MTRFERNSGPARHRRRGLGFERLKGRDLLSGTPSLTAHAHQNPFNLPPPIQAGEIAGAAQTALPHELLTASTGIYAAAMGNGLLAINYGPQARQPTNMVFGGIQRWVAAAEFSGLVFLDQTSQLFHLG